MLKVESLSKKFIENDILKFYKKEFWSKGFWAVDDLSFSVKKGETYGFLGQNGAGKTTTIKSILRIIKSTSGRVLIDGVETRFKKSRIGVGYLPEHPYFYDYLTAYEIVEYLAALSGIKGKNLNKKVDDALDLVGMLSVKNKRLREFSKGMIQRVGLATLIVSNPKLLILDEPMSGLDPLGRKLFREIFTDLKSRGVTILFSSHILSDVDLISDRVLIINKGKKVVEDSVANIKLKGNAKYEIFFQLNNKKINKEDFPFKLEKSNDYYKLIVQSDNKEFAMAELLKAGAFIFSINPLNNNLEDVFSDIINKENQDV